LDHKLRSNNPILATLRYHRRPQSLALNVARFTNHTRDGTGDRALGSSAGWHGRAEG
jgi:hypothetical protein